MKAPKNAVYRMLITDPIDSGVLAELKKKFRVETRFNLSKSALMRIVGVYDAIICRTTTRLDAEVFAAATRLRVVGIHATGWDHIDVAAATKHGVVLLGFPPDKNRFFDERLGGSFIPAAEYVVLGMLAAAGDFYATVSSMKKGLWEKYRFAGTELYGKTLGIIGLGRIGSLVAERAAAFGMRVIAYDYSLPKKEMARRGAKSVPLARLYRESDIITIHVPKTPETTGMINKKAFALMKPGVIFINTARAAVVVEKDLVEALRNHTVKTAVIDVFEHPPKGVNWHLVRMSNVLATPHIAGVSRESLKRVSSHIGESVTNFLLRGTIRGAINHPRKYT